MESPKQVFALESLNGKIWIHSTKGPLIFLKIEDAQALMKANNGRLEKKHSVIIVAMNPELSSAPFRDYAEEWSDTMALPEGALYLADLRDMVASSNQPTDITMPDIPTDDEYLDIRSKLKEMGVNPRSTKDIPKLRKMLEDAEAKVVTV